VNPRTVRVLAVLVVAAGAGGTVAWVHRGTPHHDAAPTAVESVVPGTVVHVDSGVRTTTFLPLGRAPQDGRTLSAQHAYNALVMDASKLSPIPATVRSYYGLLTDPSRSPRPVHVRVWGFAVDAGCDDATGRSAAAGPTDAPGAECRLWEFVDAWTGHHLGMLSRQVLSE
jgi:hypothetical protein